MLLPWDRLNLLKTQVETLTIEYEWQGEKRRRIRPKECCDLILDWLIECYLLGDEYVHESFSDPGFGSDMGKGTVDTDEMYETIYRKVAGKNFDQRVREYATTGDVESIMRVAETDGHRVFNNSEITTAKKLGAKEKTWNCMFINSRDTHIYLHGTTVPIDAEFYTFKGNHAQYPGQFGVAEEDCNCNCWLTFN